MAVRRLLRDKPTPLHEAVRAGDFKQVVRLLDSGSQVEAVDGSFGATPLHVAAECGHTEIMAELLDRAASIDARAGGLGHTPLYVAAWGGHVGSIALLLDAGANPDGDNRCDGTPLHYSAFSPNPEASKLLLDGGATVNAQTRSRSETPLMHAASSGHLATLEALISAGADVNAIDRFGQTALHFAAERGWPDVVSCLLRHDADPEIRVLQHLDGQPSQRTVLHYCASPKAPEESRLQVVARACQAAKIIIVHAPLLIAATDAQGLTPLELARTEGNEQLVTILIATENTRSRSSTAAQSPSPHQSRQTHHPAAPINETGTECSGTTNAGSRSIPRGQRVAAPGVQVPAASHSECVQEVDQSPSSLSKGWRVDLPSFVASVTSPDLYRINPFRILNASVAITPAELKKQQKRMQFLQNLTGGIASSESRDLLGGEPASDPESLRRVGQRLHDPVARLVDELFWFWPLDVASAYEDSGLALLQYGDIDGAHRAWTAVLCDDVNRAIANHNLAVLHHALALDIEVAAAEAGTDSSKPADVRLDQRWTLGLKYWAKVTADDAFWNRMVARAGEVDDPRLKGSEFVHKLRQSLPGAILAINVNLAVRAARRGDVDDAGRHASYVNKSDFPPDVIDRLWEREATPLVDQIRRICDPISEQSKASPANADELATRVRDECQPILDSIHAVLGQTHHLRQTAFDLVAQTIRACMIDYGNATEDWATCLPFLDTAAELASDDSLKDRLQDDLAQVHKNHLAKEKYDRLAAQIGSDAVYEVTINATAPSPVRSGVPDLDRLLIQARENQSSLRATVPNACVCCMGTPDDKLPVGLSWEETRGFTRYSRSLSFSFPVCKACRQHELEYSRLWWLLVFVAAGSSALLVLLIASLIPQPEWTLFVFLGGIGTTMLLIALSRLIRLSPLDDSHACRDRAVDLINATDDTAVFQFRHPLYADAFARSNRVKMKERAAEGAPRGQYLVPGRGTVQAILAAVVIGGISHTIIYAMMSDHWNRPPRTSMVNSSSESTSTRSQASTPTTSPSRPTDRSQSSGGANAPSSRQVSPPVSAQSNLSRQIDAGRRRIASLEAEITRMDGRLETWSTQLSGYRRQIDEFERRVRLRQHVNDASYQRAIDNHNRSVEQYNSLLEDRNSVYRDYENELTAVNALIQRYNRQR